MDRHPDVSDEGFYVPEEFLLGGAARRLRVGHEPVFLLAHLFVETRLVLKEEFRIGRPAREEERDDVLERSLSRSRQADQDKHLPVTPLPRLRFPEGPECSLEPAQDGVPLGEGKLFPRERRSIRNPYPSHNQLFSLGERGEFNDVTAVIPD